MTGVPASATGGTGTPAPGGKLGAAAVNEASLWNIANILTMVRLLLVPGFVALMLADGGYDPAWRAWAWAAFAVAMITDIFDGHLARTYNLVTDFGKIADPIADKAIMGAALICLSSLDDLPWWVTGVILGRELGITLLRFLVIRYGVIPASRGGKMKTLAQGTAVGMYVLALTGPLATFRFWVMAVAVALTVLTGLDYVRQAIVLRRAGLAEAAAAAAVSQAAIAQATSGHAAGAPGAGPGVVDPEAVEQAAVESVVADSVSAESVGAESVGAGPAGGQQGAAEAGAAAVEPVAEPAVAESSAAVEPSAVAEASAVAEPASSSEAAEK